MKFEVITNDAFRRLTELSVDASCIRAVIAYWTIPAQDLPLLFVRGLKNPAGFLCTDIHNPTSIDSLASLKKSGANVCLHLVGVSGKSEIEDSTGMPNHLLHSKVIIFDYEGRDSVVWVGSHNGTFRALDGINFECALAVQTSPDSDLYLNVLEHLTKIRTACQPFRLNLMEHYRFLQNSKLENAVSVMEFENGNDQALSQGEEITVFNMSKEDMRSCKSIDASVYVSIHGCNEILYSARVIQTGETPTVVNQSFGVRRYADRYKADLPVLLGATAVTKAMYKKDTYFAIVKIEGQLDSAFRLLEIPTQSAWINLPKTANILFEKLDVNPSRLIRQRAHKIKGLTFKVPAFEEMIDPKLGVLYKKTEIETMAFKEMRLDEKRAIKRPALIRKKLLVQR
jgi:hypothetical protein